MVNVIKSIMIPKSMQKRNAVFVSNEDTDSTPDDKVNKIPNAFQIRRRRAFSEENSSVILKLCRDMIKRGRSIVFFFGLFRSHKSSYGHAVRAKYIPIYKKSQTGLEPK